MLTSRPPFVSRIRQLHIIQMGKNKSEDALQIKLLKDELAELKSEMR